MTGVMRGNKARGTGGVWARGCWGIVTMGVQGWGCLCATCRQRDAGHGGCRLGGAGLFRLGRCRVGGLGVLGCNRYRLLPPVTGDVRSSVTRGKGGVGLEMLGYNGPEGAGVGF